MKSLIQIYTGDGKGKTTAGVGASIRAVGAGMKVLFTQFLKDGTSSEIKILESIKNISYLRPEKSFGFIKYMSEEELICAKEFYNEYFKRIIKELDTNDYQMLVIDEFMAAYNYNMIDKKEAFEFIKNKPDSLEIILTGRDVPIEIAEIADYISDIKKIKHPFDRGVGARIGIEL